MTAAGASTSEPVLPDGTWTVDRSRSEIGFAVRDMWGLHTVRGTFESYDGSLEMRAGAGAGVLRIAAGSLDTGNGRRDRHLRSPAFFDVEQHSRIVFTATAVTPRDGGLAVTGELAIGRSRMRLEIPVDVKRIGTGAVRLEGSVTVARVAAGVGWNWLGTIRGDAVLHARLTLAHASPDDPSTQRRQPR